MVIEIGTVDLTGASVGVIVAEAVLEVVLGAGAPVLTWEAELELRVAVTPPCPNVTGPAVRIRLK